MANPEIQPMLDAIGFVVDTPTVVRNEVIDELSFRLFGNYPNPFNPTTNIKFSISETQQIEIIVYDILGKKIKQLLNNNIESGIHEVEWYGDDELGYKVSSGIYFYTIKSRDKAIFSKMILQK